MEYPGDAFHTFLDLDSVTSLRVLIQKLCSEDEQICVKVKNDKIIILGWSIPLRQYSIKNIFFAAALKTHTHL